MENTAPPKAGTPQLNRVAVLPFTGDRSDYISATLSAVLGELNYKGGRAYMVMDRSLMNEILAEHQFQMTIADPATVIEFGLLSGIEGSFIGSVLYNTSTQRITQPREKTVRYEYKTSDNKTEYLTKTETYYIQCDQYNYSMNTNIRLIDYSTTQIIYNKSFNRSIQSTSCPDKTSSSKTGFPSNQSDLGTESIKLTVLSSSSDPYIIMANDILSEVAKDLGEYTLKIKADIAKKDETLSKDDLATFKDAVTFMEKGNVERACEIWNDLSRTNPNAPQLTYNIGLCHEISGDYEEALNLYGKATRLVKKPDDMFEDGIYRVRKKIAQGIQ